MNHPSVLLIATAAVELRTALASELLLDGYTVREAESSVAFGARCAPGDVSLAILGELDHPGVNLTLLRQLRSGAIAKVDEQLRVICLAAGADTRCVLRSFEAGADDVIRNPFSYAELLARVRALLRRDPAGSLAVIRHGALQIDTATRVVTFGLTPIELCRREYDLLVHLAREPERVHTKAELLRDVWGFRSPGTTRTIDSHASRLRRHLAQAGAEHWLVNVWGVGYRLAPQTKPVTPAWQPRLIHGNHDT